MYTMNIDDLNHFKQYIQLNYTTLYIQLLTLENLFNLECKRLNAFYCVGAFYQGIAIHIIEKMHQSW